MIRVNLLEDKAVVGEKKNSLSMKGNVQTPAIENFSFDTNAKTFEYSQIGQLLKIFLLISFIIPLIFFEKVRKNQDKELVARKTAEVQAIQNIKIEKEKQVKKYVNLNKKKKVLELINLELQEMKGERLIAVQSLNAIQTAVPKDIWLIGITLSKGILQIKGQTLVDTGLDLFVKNLKKENIFIDINVLKDVKVKNIGGQVLNDFLITLNINKIFKPVVKES